MATLTVLPSQDSSDKITVLLIEADPASASQIQSILAEQGRLDFQVTWIDTLAEGLHHLDRASYEIVLLDLSLTEGAWAESIDLIRSRAPQVPVIVLSGLDDENVALSAVHEGAQDYLVKPQLTRHLLVRAVRYAIERTRSDAALFQAQEKYRSIFEHITEGIFQTSPEGRYISANPALAAIYGYASPEELMTGLTDIGDQLYVDANRRGAFVRRMEESDVVRGFESQIFRKDRSIIWISENVRAVRAADKRLIYYEGTVVDITSRKVAEEELRNSEALYHSLVETLPQNILRKDLNERFTFANQRFCETLGKSLKEIIGKTDFDFFPPELAAKYQQDDRIIMETGKMLETVEEHQPPGGEKIYVNVVKTPLYDSQGNIIGLQGIFWDITEKKRAEERLRATTIELTRSRQDLQAKNAEMSEDLRMARDIQLAIIPQQYPVFPKGVPATESILRFCHRYLPTGEVGGDFFNIVALSDWKASVFICDVMGHGVRSALVTAIIRALVEELAPLASNPGQLLGQINRELRTILKPSGTTMFTTAFSAVIDLELRQISFANAGHPKPLLRHHADGSVTPLKPAQRATSPALGLFDHSTYTASDCPFLPGDTLMLFTDGLYDVEGPNQDQIHQEWLIAEVTNRPHVPLSNLFDQLLEQLRAVSVDGQLADDVCLVGVEFAQPVPARASGLPS